MAFRKGTNTLFTGAGDQTVKIWSLDQMMYVETLYGHQAEVLGIDSLNAERAVSCGDTSCHVWKVVEQSQLIFHGHNSSIDCISLVNEENFVTGSQDGYVFLTLLSLYFINHAHHHHHQSPSSTSSSLSPSSPSSCTSSLCTSSSSSEVII
jgi:WD40 repeat protein